MRRLLVVDIQRVVAQQFHLTRADLLSPYRPADLVLARQVAMYLARKLPITEGHRPRSFKEIGRRFGGRDHTTVLHAVQRIETMASASPEIEHAVELLTRRLQNTNMEIEG